jgi:hypothetical protein
MRRLILLNTASIAESLDDKAPGMNSAVPNGRHATCPRLNIGKWSCVGTRDLVSSAVIVFQILLTDD